MSLAPEDHAGFVLDADEHGTLRLLCSPAELRSEGSLQAVLAGLEDVHPAGHPGRDRREAGVDREADHEAAGEPRGGREAAARGAPRPLRLGAAHPQDIGDELATDIQLRPRALRGVRGALETNAPLSAGRLRDPAPRAGRLFDDLPEDKQKRAARDRAVPAGGVRRPVRTGAGLRGAAPRGSRGSSWSSGPAAAAASGSWTAGIRWTGSPSCSPSTSTSSARRKRPSTPPGVRVPRW